MTRLSFFRMSRAPSDVEATTDIDVTPIMNMFIILIPFLVSMAVFTHVAIIEFSLPPNVGMGLDDSQGKPKLKLTVVLTPGYTALTLGETMLDSLPSPGGSPDFAGLQQKLIERRAEIEIKDEAILAVRDAVPFKHVVGVMDACREAGFTKTGLSSATEESGADPS